MSPSASLPFNETLTTHDQNRAAAATVTADSTEPESDQPLKKDVSIPKQVDVNAQTEPSTIRVKNQVQRKGKKKSKVSRMLRRRRGGRDESEEESQDESDSADSSSESSASDEGDDRSGSESEAGSDDDEDEQEEDESAESRVEQENGRGVISSEPKPLSNSSLTDPTTVSDSLANVSISNDWAQDAQEAEQSRVEPIASSLPKPLKSTSVTSPATQPQHQPDTTSDPDSNQIPNSKKSKSQKRKAAKARKLAAAALEAEKGVNDTAAQPPSSKPASALKVTPDIKSSSDQASPAKIRLQNGNHAPGPSSTSSRGKRGGALAPPTGPRGGNGVVINGIASSRNSDPSASTRGGRGGFAHNRGGLRGGLNVSSSRPQSQVNGIKGSGNPRSRMMSWSDDEGELSDSNPLKVDEDALEGKVVKNLPRELLIPTAPRALREKQKLLSSGGYNYQKREKQQDGKGIASDESLNQKIGQQSSSANSSGIKDSSKTIDSQKSEDLSSSGTIPAGSSAPTLTSTIHTEAPNGKWDHDAFEHLAANGRLGRRKGGRTSGMANGNLSSRPATVTPNTTFANGNGQIPPRGPRSMSRNHSPDEIADARLKAQDLIASSANGSVKVKVPSSSSLAVASTHPQSDLKAQVQQEPKLPSFPPSSDNQAHQPSSTSNHHHQQQLATLPPGYAMDATGVVFDLRSGAPVAVGFMNGMEKPEMESESPASHQDTRQPLPPPENKHLSKASVSRHARTPSSIPSSAVKAAAFYPGSNAGSSHSNAGSEGRKTPAGREDHQLQNQQSAHAHGHSNSQTMMNPYAHHHPAHVHQPSHLNSHVPYYDYEYPAYSPASPFDPQAQAAMYHHQQLQAQFAYSAATGTPPPIPPHPSGLGTPILYGTPPPTAAYNPYAHPQLHHQEAYFVDAGQGYDYSGGYYNPQY